MSITQPDDRVTEWSPVVPTTTFAADFPVFDNSDLTVIHNGVERTDFTVLATYVASISNDARVVFATGITGSVLVVGAREPRRSNRFGSGPINANMLNAAFDTVQGEMQEARRDIERGLLVNYGDTPPNISDLQQAIEDAFAASAAAVGAANGQYRFASAMDLAAADVPTVIKFVSTAGYYSAGDGGGALYVEHTEPTLGGFVSNDGTRFWKNAETIRNVRMYGAKLDGVFDDTAAFQAACSISGTLLVVGGIPNITETISLASKLTICLISKPWFKIEASGQKRGLWFPFGTSNSHILGDGSIDLTVNVADVDGSYNCAIGFGQFYVGADPSAIRDCSVQGKITITSVGTANGKPVHAYGNVSGIIVKGVTATGRSNYAFSTHWTGNGSSGVAPTKTWHPDLVLFDDCHVVGTGVLTLRAFTSSAGGRVAFKNCTITNVPTLGYNIFVGDYGFTFAQNITPAQAMQHVIEDADIDDCGVMLAVDGVSTGLNGTPIWAAADFGVGDIYLKGRFRGRSLSTHTGDLMGITCIDSLRVDMLDLDEKCADGLGGDMVKISGVNRVIGAGFAKVGKGPLIRNCGHVVLEISLRCKEGSPQASRYGVSTSASSFTSTTVGAKVAGDRSLIIAAVPAGIGVGAGTYVYYNDGTVTHQISCNSHHGPGVANAALVCDPIPVDIPSGASVTVETTVKSLLIDNCTIEGFASGVRCTGGADAKTRGLTLGSNLIILRWLNNGADLVAVDGAEVRAKFDNGGLAASGVKNACVLGANAAGVVAFPRVGRNCRRVRYGLFIDDAATEISYGGMYLSIDASAVNPAAIYRKLSGTNRVQSGPFLAATGITAEYNPA